jgi:putative DNA primase/helicase
VLKSIRDDVVLPADPKATITKFKAVRDFIKLDLAVEPSDFDSDPWLLGVQDGVVDLRTGDLTEADPAMMLTKQAPFAPDPTQDISRWLDHLHHTFEEDQERVDYFQKCIGAALVGDSTAKPQQFIYIYGASQSGKGTIMRALTYVLGEEQHIATFSASDLTDRGSDRHKQWLTRFKNCRIAIVEEARTHALDVGTLKILSGGDAIVANAMRQNDQSWLPTHTLFISSNFSPNFSEDTSGMARRYRPITTTKEPRSPIPGYEQGLRLEATGILAWCIDGTRRWLEEDGGGDIPMCEAVERTRDVDISYHNPFAQFIKECLIIQPGLQSKRVEIQRRFNSWKASEHDDFIPVNPQSKKWAFLYALLTQTPGVERGENMFTGVGVRI